MLKLYHISSEKTATILQKKAIILPKAFTAVKKVTEKEEMRTDLWTTTAIRNEELGEFYHDTVHRSVDWRHPYGEEISLPPDVWQRLWEELPGILRSIGAI